MAQVGEKRPLDDGYAPSQNIQVESINQAIAQHLAVIQTQSDASQVLGTVSSSLSALVSALDSGYPAEQSVAHARQTVQAVVSQVETLRAIQNTSVQALHTSCATLQNILSHATHANAPPSQQGVPAQAPPPALTPMLQPPPMLAPPPPPQPQMMQPQQMQQQMFAPQMQMPQMQMQMQPQQLIFAQPQQMQTQMFAPPPQTPPQPEQMLYGGPGAAIADAVFGPGQGGSAAPLPAALSGAAGGDDKKKTSLCKLFPQGACKFGASCHFAHGEDDLRTRVAPQSYAPAPPTSVAFISSSAACPPMLPSLVGNFMVDPSTMHMPMMGGSVAQPGVTTNAAGFNLKQKTELCKNFMMGACRYGERCSFAHGEHELRGNAPTLQAPPLPVPLSNNPNAPPLPAPLSSHGGVAGYGGAFAAPPPPPPGGPPGGGMAPAFAPDSSTDSGVGFLPNPLPDDGGEGGGEPEPAAVNGGEGEAPATLADTGGEGTEPPPEE